MPSLHPRPRLTAVVPPHACPGGLVRIEGRDLLPSSGALPEVRIGGQQARVTAASATWLQAEVSPRLPGGTLDVTIANSRDAAALEVARTISLEVHQVDSPVIDAGGRIYATFSGSRGEQAPVSIFRITSEGLREPFSSSVVNPTSMALGPDGALYVSSRFEGTVSRLADDGSAVPIAANLGVACGLAFDPAGTLFVGDRSGTIFRVNVDTGNATAVATLPPSVAAFHLAFGPDGWLYVTGPTLSPADRVYRLDPARGAVETVTRGFGRPQGLAFDASGVLHVADALAGASGVYRVDPGAPPHAVVAGDRLVGLAFGRDGSLVVAGSDVIYRFDRFTPAAADRRARPH